MLNQICGHWLFGGELHFVITKTWELCDEVLNLALLGNMGDLEANVFV